MSSDDTTETGRAEPSFSAQLEISDSKTYDDLGEVNHQWLFDVDPETQEAIKTEFVQGGESYQVFDVPTAVENLVNDLGFEVVEP